MWLYSSAFYIINSHEIHILVQLIKHNPWRMNPIIQLLYILLSYCIVWYILWSHMTISSLTFCFVLQSPVSTVMLWSSWIGSRKKRQASFTSLLSFAKPAVTIEIFSSNHSRCLVTLCEFSLLSGLNLKPQLLQHLTNLSSFGKSLHDRHSDKNSK